jgi:hypothetical protein
MELRNLVPQKSPVRGKMHICLAEVKGFSVFT